jgi:hypothetical protein
MTLQPNFANSANWELIGQISGNAQLVTVNNEPKIFQPINSLTLPLTLEKHTLAISVETNSPKDDNWQYGGNALMLVNTGITVGGVADSVVSKRSLFLNRINLIRFPAIAPNYSLKFSIPYWFHNVNYIVFQYIGAGVADVEGKLDQIYQEILP